MPSAPKAEAICAIVGEEAAEVTALAQSLVDRRGVDGRTATFREPRALVTELSSGGVKVTYHLVKDPDDLIDLNPNVVVLCYTPLDPNTMEDLLDIWNPGVDRIFPRPMTIVCGTRVDLLANRKVLQKLHERQIQPISADDACEVFGRLRISGYNELSATSYTGVSALETSIAKAVLGEPDKKMTPELVATMRTACVQAASKKQATWAARRDPRSGKLFYVNRHSRKSVWERPSNYDGDEPELTEKEKLEEQQKKFKADEEKKALERDREASTNFMKDFSDLTDRQVEYEKREDALKLQVATLRLELDHIRAQIESNYAEKTSLETQKESFLNNQKDFHQDNNEEDLRIEKELQAAKAKAFELEAMNALREERDFDVDIAESVLRNRSLATSLREVLQEQLRTQKSGAASHARTSLANKKLEESTKLLSQLQAKVVEVRQEKQETEAEIEKLQKVLREEEGGLQKLVELTADKEFAPMDRHNKERKLLEMIEELDNRIAKLQAAALVGQAGGSNTLKGVKAEVDRLQADQRALITTLASARAQNALLEVRIEKQMAVYKHVESDRLHAFEHLVRVKTEALSQQQASRKEFFRNDGYSPVPKAAIGYGLAELEATISDLSKAHQTAHVKKATAEAQNMYSVLKQKQQALDQSGDKLSAAANRNATTIRGLKQANAVAMKTYSEVLAGASTTLAEAQSLVSEHDTRITEGHSSFAGRSALERLRQDTNQALFGDTHMLKLLTDIFSQNVASQSRTQYQQQHSSPIGGVGSPSRSTTLASLQASGAQLTSKVDTSRSRKAESDLKRLTESVAKEINRENPTLSSYNSVTVPKSFRAKSGPIGKRGEWTK